MKKFFRMIIFSCVSLFGTSWWNKGFILSSDLYIFLFAIIAILITFYVIYPILKIVLIPLHILTLGLATFALIVFFIHVLSEGFHLFEISSWKVNSFTILGTVFPSVTISYFLNLILSSLSLSGIIQVLEKYI